MLTETPKQPISFVMRQQKTALAPTKLWYRGLGKPKKDFLEWVLERRLVLAPDCSLMVNVGWNVLETFHEAWRTHQFDPALFDRREPPWLRYGDYRLYLAEDGCKLTVQKGNKYGHFIDCQNFEGNLRELGKGLRKFGICQMPYPASAGRLANGLMQEATHPDDHSLPDAVFKLAWQACKGSRMEALSLGTVKGYAYDINSAFPHAARDLPWCRCKWEQVNTYQGDAAYGIAEITAHIPPLPAGPLALRLTPSHDDDTSLAFPCGDIRVTASKPELELLNDMGIPYEIHQAWWGYPTTSIRPFHRLMDMLWHLRDYDKAGAKRLSVACVGLLGSVADNGEDGSYVARHRTNPIYFSHIYAETRCRVYRKALEVGLDHVKAFTIDGLVVDNQCKTGDGLFGEWRMESQGEYFIANSYFKDRTDSHRWREWVAKTPSEVPQSHFQAHINVYVGLRLAMERKSLRNQLGGSVTTIEELPLGSPYRQMPEGITREDYLKGEIETWLPQT